MTKIVDVEAEKVSAGPPLASSVEELYTDRPHAKSFHWKPKSFGATIAGSGVKPAGNEIAPAPDLKMFCAAECEMVTQFVGQAAGFQAIGHHGTPHFQRTELSKSVVYVCANCRKATMTIPLNLEIRQIEPREYVITKIGEYPPVVPPVPKAVKRFLNTSVEWELYGKGRRCESQGLGIAAFAYYRRIVETQWQQLLDRLISTCKSLGHHELVQDLELAKTNWQFSNAVDQWKAGVPDRLKVQGQNPLLLLHGAISNGIHGKSDADCLADAAAVRTILEQTLIRMREALEEESQIGAAVHRLSQQKNGRTPSSDS